MAKVGTAMATKVAVACTTAERTTLSTGFNRCKPHYPALAGFFLPVDPDTTVKTYPQICV